MKGPLPYVSQGLLYAFLFLMYPFLSDKSSVDDEIKIQDQDKHFYRSKK
jgi:hypothetical protein